MSWQRLSFGLAQAWLRDGLVMVVLSYDSALDLQWLVNAFAIGGSAMAWYSNGNDMAVALQVFVNGLAMARQMPWRWLGNSWLGSGSSMLWQCLRNCSAMT